MKIFDVHDMGYSELARFTDGYSTPLFRVMHLNSAGGGGALDWSAYPLSGDTPLDELRRFCHYDEAIPCLSGLAFERQKILIIGSSVPWLECLVAGKGASDILTVEYSDVGPFFELLETRVWGFAVRFLTICSQTHRGSGYPVSHVVGSDCSHASTPSEFSSRRPA